MLALEPTDPQAVGRYRLLARIGAGGMAIMYFGRSGSGRAVAVKVMHAEFAREPEYRERFSREVAATTAVGGGYGPAVLDADPNAAIPWLATEFLPAVSLRDAVRELGPLPTASVWPLAAGLAEALASIHRAGIVHLDLKPANVLLTADGPRVIDFGIAADLRAAPATTPAGTRGFMSPEQSAGGPVGPASDVYSYGATLAYACTGARPGGPPEVDDEDLRAMIASCLRPDPAARPSVTELSALLAARSGAEPLSGAIAAQIDRRAREADNPPTLPARPRATSRRSLLIGGAAVAGAVVVVGGGAGLVAYLVDRPTPTPTPGPRHEARASRGIEPGSVSPPTSVVPTTQELEFYAYGTSKVRWLKITVNGKTQRVNAPKLPWRKKMEIPVWPKRTHWRVDYRISKGAFRVVVLVDGAEYGSGGETIYGGPDDTESAQGTI